MNSVYNAQFPRQSNIMDRYLVPISDSVIDIDADSCTHASQPPPLEKEPATAVVLDDCSGHLRSVVHPKCLDYRCHSEVELNSDFCRRHSGTNQGFRTRKDHVEAYRLYCTRPPKKSVNEKKIRRPYALYQKGERKRRIVNRDAADGELPLQSSSSRESHGIRKINPYDIKWHPINICSSHPQPCCFDSCDRVAVHYGFFNFKWRLGCSHHVHLCECLIETGLKAQIEQFASL